MLLWLHSNALVTLIKMPPQKLDKMNTCMCNLNVLLGLNIIASKCYWLQNVYMEVYILYTYESQLPTKSIQLRYMKCMQGVYNLYIRAFQMFAVECIENVYMYLYILYTSRVPIVA